METYDNIILKRIGYILFLVVLAVHIFNIGGGCAEAANVNNTARKTVTFGAYDQDCNPDNGQEPIEWIVLEEKDGKCLLLSKCGLDTIPYHNEDGTSTWEQCSLRRWMNSEFLQNSFTDEEQAAIQTTKVVNGSGQGAKYSVDGGPDTEDRIFLLSYRDVFVTYFPKTEDRLCQPTQAATANGVFSSPDGCAWWLRSPSDDLINAMLVDYDGREMFSNIHFNNTAFRPALWVNAEAVVLK